MIIGSKTSVGLTSTDTTLPRPSILLIVVEFWERFSYYGIMAIMVLFLSAETARGGFGWPVSSALALLSLFSGLAFASPIVGGIVADRYIGTRRAVTYGTLFLTVGNFAFVLAIVAPGLWDSCLHTHAHRTLLTARVPLGLLFPQTEHWTAMAAAADSTYELAAATLVYHTQTGLFYGALGLVILGNAFLKSTLPVLLGQVFDAYGGRSDAAYNYYYMAITLGAVASSFAVGYLGQQYGWASGFACAALGMSAALALFLTLSRRMLGSTGLLPQRRQLRHDGSACPDKPLSRYAIGLMGIGVYSMFLIIFAIGWVQYQGLWVYVIENQVQRTIHGFSVPTPWIVGFYSIIVVVYAPIFARLSRWLAGKNGAEPAFGARFIAGFLLLAVCHGLMAVGFAARAGALVSVFWPLAGMLVLGIAEVVVWPASYGMVQRISPPRLRGALLGGWIAMLGVGQSIAHLAAARYGGWGFSKFSGALCALMILSGVLLWLVDWVMFEVSRRSIARNIVITATS